jgi:O-antigen/teichoic acid export membrane protein
VHLGQEVSSVKRLARGTSGVLMANVGARIGALVSLALATLLVAWSGGPTAVGIYTLARVVPGLVGVVMACGLPGAVPYFLSGPDRDDRRVPLTLVAITLCGGLAGTALWAAASPLLGKLLFPDLSPALVLLIGATVTTQVLVAAAKASSQGSDDLPGANLVILNEELLFLPAYGLLWAAGVRGYEAAILGLLLADVATFVPAWWRLARRGFFKAAGRPSLPVARRIASYGMRAQLGGVIFLLNLRLDFILISVLTGPAVLGIYAVASKFAELVKVPGMALTYVLYPRYAKEGTETATATARRLLPRAALAMGAGVIPLALAAGLIIPVAYGSAFEPAVVPAQLILLGLCLEGVSGVTTGYLYGVGRPGLNSWAMAAGLAVTVGLDLILIPAHGAVGAAIASAAAYMTTSLALLWFFYSVGRSDSRSSWSSGRLSGAAAE